MNKSHSTGLNRYLVREIGQHRGSPRIYLETQALASAGFVPGATYDRTVNNNRITLTVQEGGPFKVSKKEKRGSTLPVIDINSREALSPLDGLKAVRMVIQEGVIHIMPTASEANAKRRLERLKNHIESGKIVSASLSHGGGILDHAAHAGLADAGLDASLAFANEIDGDLLEHSAENNEVWSPGSMGIGAPMQEMVQDEWLLSKLPPVDILAVGIPCSGASRAGVSKRGLEMMENHPEVGHLVASFLMVVQKTQPSIVVVECVKEYERTASAQIMRQHLRDCGYSVNEITLSGKDFGVLENRTRWFMVATTSGITVDLQDIQPKLDAPKMVSDILEDVAPDDVAWRDFAYLKSKAIRDQEKGNGFAMQIVSPEDNSVPVLRKGYHKGGSTDPLVKHPDNGELFRLFTAKEHARIKEIPEHLIEGMSQTKAHELLGQSVLHRPARALFERIGNGVKAWSHASDTKYPSAASPYQLSKATG